MKLPKELRDKTEWILVGPMGPDLPDRFRDFPIMAVDGGARFTGHMNAWVGDSDSCKIIPENTLVFRLPEEKDSSDYSCALKLFDQQVNYTLHLWGLSGGRKDHELFVWGETLSFLEQHPESKCILYGAEGNIETYFLGSGHWKFQHTGRFSLGSLRKIRVKLTGDVKYPIGSESWLPALSSWGLSNVGSGEMVLENEGAAFLHYPGEKG